MNISYIYYFYKKHLLIWGILLLVLIISMISIYIYTSSWKTNIYTNNQTQYFNITDLNTESWKLYIDIEWKWYKAIEFTLKTDIDIKENKKIDTFFWWIDNLLTWFNGDKQNWEFNFYRLCNDDKCEQSYNISLFTEIKNKFIDKYLFPAPNEYTNTQETIAMNTAIRQSCYWNDKKYPKMDLCEILNIEPIFKIITINIIYHLKNGKTKTKTLIFNS